ncbi:MAG: hypothetical protein ACD_28C00110G0005 [uncultured bacterium]|nr:MAG: hypothetical protein ACD_28C00110G0005 [uncultured bacterium]KKT76296.1 MAG: hypothetical protein UW70_C0019G0014 [Candidatus Peregrinibacteria bacterium GW2011_GWA2_44_7]
MVEHAEDSVDSRESLSNSLEAEWAVLKVSKVEDSLVVSQYLDQMQYELSGVIELIETDRNTLFDCIESGLYGRLNLFRDVRDTLEILSGKISKMEAILERDPQLNVFKSRVFAARRACYYIEHLILSFIPD